MRWLARAALTFSFLIILWDNGYAKKEGRDLADSLLKELRKAKEDTNKVNILNAFMRAYNDISPDSVILFANAGMALATNLKWEKGIANANISLGYGYQKKQDYARAFACYDIALKTDENIGYKEGVAIADKFFGGAYMEQSDFHKALQYYSEELKMQEATDNKLGLAVVLGNIGLAYFDLSDYSKAIEYDLKSLSASQEIGDKYGVATMSWNIGLVYDAQSNYAYALSSFLKALKIFEELGSKRDIASLTGDIGNAYEQMGDRVKAKEYLYEAFKESEETGDKLNMSLASQNLGNMYAQDGEYEKALDLQEKALKIAEETGDKNGILAITLNIGNVYAALHNYALAIEYQQKSLQIAEEIGDKIQAGMALESIGSSFLDLYNDTAVSHGLNNTGELHEEKYKPNGMIPAGKKAQLQKAIEYLIKAIALANEINTPITLQKGYADLSEAYKLSGDYKRSLENYQKYTAVKDSVLSGENKVKIMKMSVEREYDKKADEAQKRDALKLQQQRTYTYMGIAGVVLLLGFSFFIVRERRKSEVERKKSDNLLLNILPEEVAAELKLNGNTVAKQYDNVTVLFTDFVNFTSAGEKMSPQALVDELHACFRTFDAITDKYNIEKIKTIGDAYLAVAGLPLPDTTHAENAVRAAIEINNYMKDREAKLGDKTFEIRIGIHSGSVVAGIVGVKKFAYDIWGDTVNTAARMQQSSEPGKINISETTYDLVKDKFACLYRGEIDAKNKGWLKMYYVSNAG